MSDAEKYQSILEKDPTDTQAFVNLCNIAEKDGDYEYLAELLKYRAQVTRDEQEIVDLYFRTGEVYIDKLNDVQRGAEALLEGFDRDPTHAGIGEKLDEIYRDAEDWNGAAQLAESRLQALSQADVNGTKVVIRSDLHQQAGEVFEKALSDEEKALAHYRKAIELDKTNIMAIYGAREIYYKTGKFKNAAKLCELEARVEKDPDRKIALYRELAHILGSDLSDHAQAVVALKRALKLNQEDPEIKLDLARTIAGTTLSEENKKDHRWASEYLMRAAKDAPTEMSLELAGLALTATPSSAKAVEFIEAKARELGDLEALAKSYEKVIEAAGSVENQAPMIRRLAKVYIEEVGSPERALEWMKRLEPLGMPDDARVIERLSKGVQVRASQAPAPASESASPQPEHAASLNEPDEGAFAEQAEAVDQSAPGEVVEEIEPEMEAAPQASYNAPPAVPDGMSEEDFVAQLQSQAETARRGGDDATAEERMLQVLDYAPHDQKATTYLERRFRARGDWASLRDLLLKSAGAPHLPAAVQTVRLREAARLSEEQLGDMDGAITAWKTIQENDPKVRDAADALKRLLSETERWDELLGVLENEAATTKSRAKRIEAFRRLAEIYKVRLGDAAKAADAYNKVLDLAPDDSDAIEALDELYLREQQYEELVPLLQKRAEMTRDREEKRAFTLRAAVTLRERLGRNEEAYEKAKEVLSIAPGDQETLELMESIDEESEQWERLLETLTMRARAESEDQPKADILKKKALICAHRLGDNRGAVRGWHEVLAVLPGDEETLESLADIHEGAGEWQELVDALRLRLDSLEDANDKAEQHRRIAHVLEDKLERPDEAMESWRLVLEAGEDVESLGALSRYYERIEDWSELVEVLERQAPLSEDHIERAGILYKRAEILFEKQGEREEAEAALKKVMTEVDPSHVPTLDLLRRILAEDEKYEEAVEVLEQEIAHIGEGEQLTDLMVLLGDWSRNKLDDLDRAMDAYERAAAMDMGDEELLDTLDEIYVEVKEWDKLLKLMYGRYQRMEDEQERLAVLMRGGKICEEELDDKAKAWSWYRQAFDALRHLDGVVEELESIGERLELWTELIDMYGVMTRTAEEVSQQAGWWLKIAEVFEEKKEEPAQGLEAMLRAFGLEPDREDHLDSVDRLAVKSKAWQRMSVVYNTLAQRAQTPEEKIAYLTRYAKVLHEQGQEPSMGFDVAMKALEVDLENNDVLTMVEEMGNAAERYDDMVKIYTVCSKRSDEVGRKAELKMRAAKVMGDKLEDPDGALTAALEVLSLDAFSQEVVQMVWEMVRELESALLTTEKGTYWGKLIEVYRGLVAENRHERENQVDLLMVIAKVYAEELSDDSAAFECLKEAQQINPRDEDTIDKLERMAGEQNFWEGVVDHYADILDETFEMDVAVMYHRRRARILSEELDRADEAAEHYWQIIQLDSSDENAYHQLLLHYESTEKWNELVNLLERQLDATKEEEKKQKVLLQIAAVWEKKIKNKYEAKDWYEQVVTIWPDNEDAKAGIARLESGEDTEDEDDDIRSLISIPPPPMEKEEEEESVEKRDELDGGESAFGDETPEEEALQEDPPEDENSVEDEEAPVEEEVKSGSLETEEGEDDEEGEDEAGSVDGSESDTLEEAPVEEELESTSSSEKIDFGEPPEGMFTEEEAELPVPEPEQAEEIPVPEEPADMPSPDAETVSFMPSSEETLDVHSDSVPELPLDDKGEGEQSDLADISEEEVDLDGDEIDADDLIVSEEAIDEGAELSLDDDVIEEIDDSLLELDDDE